MIPLVLAFGLAVTPMAARAQGELSTDPVVRAIQVPLVAICRQAGLYPWFVADFYFGADAEGDGRGNDTLLDGAGFSCVSSPGGDDGANPYTPMCRTDGICTRWLIVDGPRGRRLVWSGMRPGLFSMGDDGLINTDNHCRADGCNRVIWNGRALVPAPRRRR
jgi:hypothetical protein